MRDTIMETTVSTINNMNDLFEFLVTTENLGSFY